MYENSAHAKARDAMLEARQALDAIPHIPPSAAYWAALRRLNEAEAECRIASTERGSAIN